MKTFFTSKFVVLLFSNFSSKNSTRFGNFTIDIFTEYTLHLLLKGENLSGRGKTVVRTSRTAFLYFATKFVNRKGQIGSVLPGQLSDCHYNLQGSVEFVSPLHLSVLTGPAIFLQNGGE